METRRKQTTNEPGASKRSRLNHHQPILRRLPKQQRGKQQDAATLISKHTSPILRWPMLASDHKKLSSYVTKHDHQGVG